MLYNRQSPSIGFGKRRFDLEFTATFKHNNVFKGAGVKDKYGGT